VSEFKPRVFLANDGRPHMAKEAEGSIWIHFLHADKRTWVTLANVELQKGHLIVDNLTEFEQSLYPPFLPEPPKDKPE